MSVRYQQITAEQTLDLRHRVMWPDKPRDAVRVPGDDTAHHVGAFTDDLVGVASFFPDDQGVRLRKLAVDPAHQRKGIARGLISFAVPNIGLQDHQTVWCDARETALPFYQNLGFKIDDVRFYKSDVAYFKAFLSLKDLRS